MITQEDIDRVWAEAPLAPNKDSRVWRKDPCGALICREQYGKRGEEYGWEIDHIVPRAYLFEKHASDDEIDDPDNLRAMHWANNDSKGTNYPEYKAVRVAFDGTNIKVEAYYTVSAQKQQILKQKYRKYGL